MNYNRPGLYFAGFNYALKSLFTPKEMPFIGGIALNDSCNLHCRHCFVSNRNIPDMTFDEIRSGLVEMYKMGMRCLYLEGGEPFLWKDGEKRLEDVINLARSVGFRYLVVYTNGTFPIITGADMVFVSLDGLRETHDRMRGKCYDRIIFNIGQSEHRKVFVNYTVTAINLGNITGFCEEMRNIPNIKGVNFYFYTPCNGKDELYLNAADKVKAIDEILTLKKKGYRILNSVTTLKSFANGNWKRPNGLSYLFAENTMYRCCRAVGSDEICDQCGYLGLAEIYHMSQFNINSLLTALKYL
jgi:Fe-coproporphyrin III synthase